MNVMAHASSSFEEARRRHLIEATIEAVADVGFKAASLSEIAKRANVSTSLYAHYFHDKDGLLEATLRFLAARLALALRARLRLATTPRERLYAVVDAALGDQEFERRTSAVWLAFWGQIAHSDRFQRIQYAYQRRLHTTLRHAFRACVPTDRAEPSATIVAGLIDGLWLQSHAYKDGANAGRARETVHQVIDTLIDAAGLTNPARDAPGIAAAAKRPKPQPRASHRKLIAHAQRGAALWAGSSARERSATLQRYADLVVEQAPTLARLEADATGRPLRTVLDFVIPRCALAFRQAADRALAPVGVHHEFEGVTSTELGVFHGVSRAAAHRSAPLLDTCRAVARALGGGGAIVVDLPQAARAVAAALDDLLAQAGVPVGAVGLRFGDPAATDGLHPLHPEWHAQSAAIILGDADVARAIDMVLVANDPSRRTRDLSETLLFVETSALKAAEDAAIAWCRRATSALDPTCGSGRGDDAAIARAVEAGRAAGADIVHGRGRSGEATILRLRATAQPVGANLFAPLLQVVGLETDADLLTIFAQAEFDSVLIFSGDERRAYSIARAAPAAFVAINAYDLTCASAIRELRHVGQVPARRLLTFGDARGAPAAMRS